MNRIGDIINKVKHLRAANSASAGSVLRRALTLPLDYMRDDGFSGRLVNITLETTYRCNLECEFCFLRGNRLNRKDEELTLAEIESLAAQARRLGCGVYITGGEPFLRKDGVEIIEAFKAAGVRTGVNTNATLLDEEKARRLLLAGMDYAIISLHGGPEFHDEAVGKRGAHERAMRAIRALRNGHKTHVLVNFVITARSAPQLPLVVEACAQAGVDALTVQHLTFLTERDIAEHGRLWKGYFGDDDTGLVYSLVDPAGCDVEAIAKATREGRELARKRGVCMIVKPDLGNEMLREWYSVEYRVHSRCLYPWTEARIAPNGEVYACQFIPFAAGNIREASLEEILNNQRYRKFRKNLKDAGGQFPGCARCCKLYRGGLKSRRKDKSQD